MVSRVLLVESDLLVSTIVSEAFLGESQIEVQCAWSGEHAIKLITSKPFDFAFVSVMKDRSGIVVAEHAANENIPVLLTSGHPATQMELKRLGYPFLAKPYSVSELLVLVRQIMLEHAANIQCVRASAAKMMANARALAAAMAESKRLIEESRRIMSIRSKPYDFLGSC